MKSCYKMHDIVQCLLATVACIVLLLLITLWQSNYNEAMKYKVKVQIEILTISLAKGLWTTSATLAQMNVRVKPRTNVSWQQWLNLIQFNITSSYI